MLSESMWLGLCSALMANPPSHTYYPRLAFEKLTSVEKDSRNFAKQVGEQSEHYSAWRDVRSDGNCFYRAVACALLEHYCRPFTPLSELENFCRRLDYQETEPARDENIADYLLVLRVLMKVMDLKKAGSPTVMEVAHQLLSSDTFLIPFIKVLRYVAWSALKAFHPEPYWEGLEEEPETKLLLDNRHSAGDLDAIGIAWGLDVKLRLVEMGKANVEVNIKQFEPGTRVHAQQPDNCIPTDPTGRLHLHVGLNAGHFMAFYPEGLQKFEEEREQRYVQRVEADPENCESYARLIRA